jgi:L-lactate dehydrogenase complex protein LldG
MSDAARGRILARLRAAPRDEAPARPAWAPTTYATPDERIAQFGAMLKASHAEVYEVGPTTWPARLRSILANRVGTLLFAPTTEAGRQLANAWAGQDGPTLLPYDRPVEELKPRLVNEVAAAVTATLGGVAETGSLVLWPTPEEPRLMSLLPPIHVALVDTESVVDNLAQLITAKGWANRMPTNALLISGPSKTADIEQTLAYGVHGPKELIVLMVRRS